MSAFMGVVVFYYLNKFELYSEIAQPKEFDLTNRCSSLIKSMLI